MTRDDWKAYERIQNEPNVKLAMRARCEEQDHQWENRCNVFLTIYEACKWCGETKK